jgi:hypothetical protein
MKSRIVIGPSIVAVLTSAAFAQDCPVTTDVATYPNPPLTYPMTSDRYTVQYMLNGGTWTDVRVYVSYYGGTNSSPYIQASHYPADTSMSFASIPVVANAAVALRVTKLFGSPFSMADQVLVRPRVKGIQVDSVSGSTVQLSTTTAANFAGEQFILWWNGNAQQSSAIEGHALFLNPPYTRPTGSNVKTISAAADLTADLSSFDTLDFEGTVAIGSTGAVAFVVPVNINNIYFGPAAWVQGKLRFMQTGTGQARRIYGPGVLDVSRFDYMYRQCRNSTVHTDDGYQSLSWVATAQQDDRFTVDGLIISDSDYYATDHLTNATINNTKIVGWNGNNDGFQFGKGASASNVFVRTGDDSLKMWNSNITVTNATVWQNWNGGVVNLGWANDTGGDDSLIDGLYVVKTDWGNPKTPSWSSTDLNADNDAIIASLQTPGTTFGTMQTSTYRNIYVEDPPRVLFSLKILPPDCSLSGQVTCPPFDPAQPSVLNLNIANVFSPPSLLQNSIGFQNVNGVALTGTMNIGLDNAGTIGVLSTNGNGIDIGYAAFLNGAAYLGSGVYYLQFPNGNLFGYYNLSTFPILYHYDLGFESFVDANDGQGGVYFYDFSTSHWFYTSAGLFPYLYDFKLHAWLYYFPSTKNPGHYTSNPRYFSNLTTGNIITQ